MHCNFYLALTLLLICWIASAIAQDDPSERDCNDVANFCGDFGSCKPDGFCGCVRGFRGATCALFPPHLEKGWKIPGQVDEDSPEAFYSVNEEEFSTTTQIELVVIGSGSPVNFYASIGILPTKEIAQWQFENSQKVEFRVDSTELASNAVPGSRKVLFIVIQAANSPDDKIAFTITHKGGGVIGGLEDWQFGAILGGSICCCCIIICIIIAVVCMSGGKDKDNQTYSGNNVQMEPGYSGNVANAPPGSGYPSANNTLTSPNNPYGGSQSAYPSSMGNDAEMQPGYNMGGQDPSVSGRYDNSSSVGGYTPGGTADTMLQRPGGFGSGTADTMLQRPGGPGMQPGYGMGDNSSAFSGGYNGGSFNGGGFDNNNAGGFDNGGGFNGGNDFGGPSIGGYQMDENTQALW